MFVLTTLLTLWLGWRLNLVHRRQEIIQSIQARGGRFDTRATQTSAAKREAVLAALVKRMTHRSHDSHGTCRSFAPTAEFELTAVRQLLGDKLYWDVVIYDRSDLEAVRRWFPEAVVLLVEEPGHSSPVRP